MHPTKEPTETLQGEMNKQFDEGQMSLEHAVHRIGRDDYLIFTITASHGHSDHTFSCSRVFTNMGDSARHTYSPLL
jgi:hypothetical protein